MNSVQSGPFDIDSVITINKERFCKAFDSAFYSLIKENTLLEESYILEAVQSVIIRLMASEGAREIVDIKESIIVTDLDPAIVSMHIFERIQMVALEHIELSLPS